MNNNNSLTRLPRDILHYIFIQLDILNNDDFEQLYATNRYIGQFIRRYTLRRVVVFDYRTNLRTFMDRWRRDARRHRAFALLVRGRGQYRYQRIPLISRSDLMRVLLIFPNVYRIRLERLNPFYHLMTLRRDELPHDIQFIDVDWRTCRSNGGVLHQFYSANFVYRETIRTMVLPPDDITFVVYEDSEAIGLVYTPLEDYLLLFPHFFDRFQ